MAVRHETVAANGLDFHVAVAGEGPLVLLAHGFPELWYSWRHQIAALAAAGYRVAAPDLRGYGGTSAPEPIDQYTVMHLVGDMVALVRALGSGQAHIVGHDWGSAVAWHAALLRPEVFPTVTGISVPFTPRNPAKRPLPRFVQLGERQGREFYMVRFQEPGVAEAEFEADLDRAFRMMSSAAFDTFVTPGRPIWDGVPVPDSLPDWLSAEDLAVYVEAYQAHGFRGPLNYYRNLDRNWELTAPWQDAVISQPALFITGEHDPVRSFSAVAEANLPTAVPNLTESIVVPGSGHWVQQEAPDAVTNALLSFLAKAPAIAG